MQPDFSILMLSFNQAQYISFAIDSVLSQPDVNVELIIVDPGSTDGSREIIINKANQDARIKLIFEPDSGPADGLRKAWDEASGKLVGCLNSDDLYLPYALMRVKETSLKNPKTDILTSSGYLFTERGYRFQNIDKYSPRRYALGIGLVLHQSTFYDRIKLNSANVKFNVHNKSCWDGEILMDAWFSGMRIHRFRDAWGAFRIHGESITGSQRLSDIYQNEHILLAERGLNIRVNKSVFEIFQLISRFWALSRRLRAPFEHRVVISKYLKSIMIFPER